MHSGIYYRTFPLGVQEHPSGFSVLRSYIKNWFSYPTDLAFPSHERREVPAESDMDNKEGKGPVLNLTQYAFGTHQDRETGEILVIYMDMRGRWKTFHDYYYYDDPYTPESRAQ